MEFISLLGGQADFNKLTISIVQHRGSTSMKLLAKGKNVKVVSKIYNGREKDKEGNPLVSYTCTPIQLPDEPITLGDEVLLIQKDLGIQEKLRIVRYGYNPYDPIEAAIELSNFVSGLEDQLYRIETQTVTKDKLYNGAKIGPDEGFVATRSDNKVKSVLNATEGIAVKTGDGGGTFANKFYVDTDGNVHLDDSFLEIIKGIVKILISPDDGIKIQNNGVDKFWVDTNGVVNLRDMIATGAITGGTISGVTITAKDELRIKGNGDPGIIFEYEGTDPGYVGNAPATMTFQQHTTSGADLNSFTLDVGDGLLELIASQGATISGGLEVSGLTVNSTNTYLRNGCYIEARSDGLRLHSDANNYLYIGDAGAYAVVNGSWHDLAVTV